MSLLISTVLSGSRNRLAPLVDAPCTMPGIAAAMLGLHDQHVAAVALGDDLVLQILRRLLPAQIRLERAAQTRPLLAQPVANHLQLRARVVDHLARRVDLVAHLRDFALERRGAAAGRSSSGNDPARPADARCASRRPNRGTSASASSRSGFERASFDRERRRGSAADRSRRAAETPPFVAMYCAVSVVAASSCATFCASVDGCSCAEALRAHRRQREAAHGLDDAIEFEGPKGAGLHSGEPSILPE